MALISFQGQVLANDLTVYGLDAILGARICLVTAEHDSPPCIRSHWDGSHCQP